MLRQIISLGMSGKAISAGYPDMLSSPDEVKDLLGCEDLPVREDSAKIIQWHCLQNKTEIVETKAVFKALGYELDVLDIKAWRGGEIIGDLNHEFTMSQYDLVLDLGTIEHCFNIAQAARNLAGLVKMGGVIVHHTPCSMFNHGFYNVNPLWFHHVYPSWGFEIEKFGGEVGGSGFELPPRDRFKSTPNNSMNVCVARRVRERTFTWPTQDRYST